MKTPRNVLDFWLSDESRKRSYNSNPDFDDAIRTRFEETANALAEGPFPHPVWEADAESAAALIICLDQLPRNMHRGSPRAFAWDHLALAAARRTIEKGWDKTLPESLQGFIYMPFMHAEDLAAQERSVMLSEAFGDAGTLRHAIAHRDVIARFGRFPHRNDTVGRESTAEEREFLANGGYDPS